MAHSTQTGGTGEANDFPRLVRQAEELAAARMWSEAAALLTQALEINPTRGLEWALLGRAHYEAGHYGEAIPAFVQALELGSFPHITAFEYNFPWQMAYEIARCHACLGDTGQALTWLERAISLGYRQRLAIYDEPAFASLRDEPRFQQLTGHLDTHALSRDEGWRHDLALLAEEAQRLHYAQSRHVAPQVFRELVERLHADIPHLSDDQVVIGFMRLMRQLGDGHSDVSLGAPATSERFPEAPISFFAFIEGTFVTAAAPEYAGLVGAQVLAIGAQPLEQVIAALDPLISRDNAMTVLDRVPQYLRRPRLLHALGIVPDPQKLLLTVRDGAGTVREATVGAGDGLAPYPVPEDWPQANARAGAPVPLYLRGMRNYWFEYLPEHATVYVQYRAVALEPDETMKQFATRLFDFVDGHEVKKLVLDVRLNGGGNTFLHLPLFRGLSRSAKLQNSTTLFIVIGRKTFSAAMNGVTTLEGRSLEWGRPAIFVGEPTGSSPNFIGETVFVTLPYSKVQVSISDLYWQTSWPMDARIWLAPHIYTPPTFAAYRENRDPALEAILAYED